MRTSLLPLCLLVWLPGLAAGQSAGPAVVANGSLRLSADVPAAGATVSQPFLVGGWALDLLASSGSGIDAVHVWAAPLNGAAVFLGAAALNGARPDVAAVFGAQFAQAGFNLVTPAVLSPGPHTLYVRMALQRRASFAGGLADTAVSCTVPVGGLQCVSGVASEAISAGELIVFRSDTVALGIDINVSFGWRCQ